MFKLKDKLQRKYINRLINGKLLSLAIDESNSLYSGLDQRITQQFKNAFYCGDKLRYNIDQNKLQQISGDNRYTGYCKCRSCIICSGIKTASLINKYKHILNDFNFQFMTLTVPNCSESDLKLVVNNMFYSFTLIKDVMRKRNKKINGVRKIEITFNSKTWDYHPHLHCLIDSEFAAEFVDLWLKYNPLSKEWCQDLRDVDDNSLIELFKYVTKINIKNISSAYIIFKTLFGVRTFQTYGKIKAIDPDVIDDNMSFDDIKDSLILFYDKLISGYKELNSNEIISQLSEDEKIILDKLKNYDPIKSLQLKNKLL
jgi:hypothetical protein